MPTIKEYKAMMEGATDALWVADGSCVFAESGANICEVNGWYGKTIEAHLAKRIAIYRNISDELIRVIELAEEALDKGGFHATARGHFEDALCITEALSEIRKLKGE